MLSKQLSFTHSVIKLGMSVKTPYSIVLMKLSSNVLKQFLSVLMRVWCGGVFENVKNIEREASRYFFSLKDFVVGGLSKRALLFSFKCCFIFSYIQGYAG